MLNVGYIYKITNILNGKMYVGQTRYTVEKRWSDHKSQSRVKNRKYRSHILDAIRKYGEENFIIEVIEQCDDTLLDEREIYWISRLGTVRDGYNIAPGGAGFAHYEGTPVVQFDMNGNYIHTYKSVLEATVDIGAPTPQRIYSACYCKKSCMGYQWVFLKDLQGRDMKLPPRKPRPKPRPVHQYTLDGDFVTSYTSISSAASQFGYNGTGGIRSCCEGRCRCSCGFRWSYKKVDKLSPMRKVKHCRPVAMLDENGNVIKTYSTIKEAATENHIYGTAISYVCKGKRNKCGGYGWRYIS